MNLRKDHSFGKITSVIFLYNCGDCYKVYKFGTYFYGFVFLKLLNCIKNINKLKFTFNNGYLGSCIDEERSETRYVMRIAELCESSNL